MTSPTFIVLLSIAFLESGIAITLNMYIIIMDAKNIRNDTRLNPSDLIHLLRGLVNILLQCSLTVQGTLYVICVPLLFIKEVYFPITIITLTTTYCSFWLTAWLCAYYCTTITNFRYGLCVWLQRISSSSLLLLLLLTAGGTFLIGLLCIWNIKIEAEVKGSENSTVGTSFISGTFNVNPLYSLITTCLGCGLPFILILYSIILTVSSLLRHVCNMKQSDSGFTRPKLQAHLNAIRTVTLILIVFVTFCIAEIVLSTAKFSSPPNEKLVICWVIVMSYPTAESIIDIQASSKLRKVFVETFSAVCRRNTKPDN
ncbi:taste receptor type 2 member 40-like [Pseudophryne corroboree]|uniref:taste receptor type 2 member 40-like n=1 Tax=Pseudophryne corroboree TaxID=495146 RepID=UPI003081D277